MKERKRRHDDQHRPIKVGHKPVDTGYRCAKCGSASHSHLCAALSVERDANREMFDLDSEYFEHVGIDNIGDK